jgi:hypothetical protein
MIAELFLVAAPFLVVIRNLPSVDGAGLSR